MPGTSTVVATGYDAQPASGVSISRLHEIREIFGCMAMLRLSVESRYVRRARTRTQIGENRRMPPPFHADAIIPRNRDLFPAQSGAVVPSPWRFSTRRIGDADNRRAEWNHDIRTKLNPQTRHDRFSCFRFVRRIMQGACANELTYCAAIGARSKSSTPS
jgi:hypothetical protein